MMGFLQSLPVTASSYESFRLIPSCVEAVWRGGDDFFLEIRKILQASIGQFVFRGALIV